MSYTTKPTPDFIDLAYNQRGELEPSQAIDICRAQGYKIGLNWKNDWIAGGPHVLDPSYKHGEEPYYSHYLQSKAENDAWVKGFHEGLALNPNRNPKLDNR